jgi:hypothetical protein
MQSKVASIAQPAWNHSDPALCIRLLFSEPYWLPPERRGSVGKSWINAMSGYQIYLDQWASVKQWSVTIYDHLRSREMPLTTDQTQFWPEAALELLRLWINEGARENESSPLDPAERIPPPHDVPRPIRIRKDIRALTPDELNRYRAKLDDVMRVGDPSPRSPWQQLSYVHTNWCLHYQEAFLFWHRAYLLYFENMIGMAVPYWNWMAEDANVDGSPNAGIPQAFLDLTYIHPVAGEERPNPLRFAAAKDGRSKACSGSATQHTGSEADCKWVHRNPLFYTSGGDHKAEREKLIRMVRIFQNQVVNALTWPVFSQPQGWPGYPWANILVFDPPQPDSLYPNREDFDGLYEQPHDNWHGWIGFDMADNAYTAFDPVFWSYHANIDRMMEFWIRSNPAAQYTAACVVRPFVGQLASRMQPADPRDWIYTAIGDLARDSRALGYDFGPVVTPDWKGDSTAQSTDKAPLSVVFEGVRCTHDSYTIDAFLNQSAPADADVDPQNPHYIGRLSRIGMGLEDENGRCIRQGVIRNLDATPSAAALGIAAGSECELTLFVRNIATGEKLTPAQYQALPGFAGKLVWRPSGNTVAPALTIPRPAATGGSCCSNRPA